MNSRHQQTFEDVAIVQIVNDIATHCPVCNEKKKIRYRLENERGDGTCASCFLGWLEERNAHVTIDQ